MLGTSARRRWPLMEAAPAVKPRRQSPTRPPCDTTPALSPGQHEPGNSARQDLSALPDRKSCRVQVRPARHRVRLPCVKTLAPMRHRHRRERHVHVRAGRRFRYDRVPQKSVEVASKRRGGLLASQQWRLVEVAPRRMPGLAASQRWRLAEAPRCVPGLPARQR